MSKQYLLLITVLVFLAKVNSDCRDLTLDNCSHGENTAFESTNQADISICQFLCSAYSPKCTFFVYDQKEKLCELFEYDPDEYAASCNILSGTPNPALETCKNSEDDCTVRDFFICFLVFALFFTELWCGF